ncbi:hypothetical protein AR158_C338R [Paramecium bursaria Chlorella virus AR158]|uniref:hypothetical protein n=1 Tax=Paramecium bursaria Chlorella virus AR158 TaxID=380598 RepID=UPI00015AA93B|nr:hypothetical protein AR158_C338R [Paramecium bursaria Chlorella virus AR158]ABU43883.1 hypothetical protein AR158_C338R [Paramecium bursaria Chlorella virus AR158]
MCDIVVHQKNVIRFDIEMHDVLIVCMFQRGRDRLYEQFHFVLVEISIIVHEVEKICLIIWKHHIYSCIEKGKNHRRDFLHVQSHRLYNVRMIEHFQHSIFLQQKGLRIHVGVCVFYRDFLIIFIV